MTLPIALRDSADGCILPVRVHPGAKRNAITGVHDGALKISLTTPPTDGRANDALIAFLAERLAFREPASRFSPVLPAAARPCASKANAQPRFKLRSTHSFVVEALLLRQLH
jgi:uncharacterized protein (TIGR00251 family)